MKNIVLKFIDQLISKYPGTPVSYTQELETRSHIIEVGSESIFNNDEFQEDIADLYDDFYNETENEFVSVEFKTIEEIPDYGIEDYQYNLTEESLKIAAESETVYSESFSNQEMMSFCAAIQTQISYVDVVVDNKIDSQYILEEAGNSNIKLAA